MEAPHQVVIPIAQLIGTLETLISPVVAVFPEMPFQRQTESAELTEHRYAIGHYGKHAGTGIVVHVLHVAITAVGPAAGAVHEASGIVLLDPLEDRVGVVLSPAFVEGDP